MAMHQKKVMTLGVLIENGRILLGLKKRGFGAGKWNGFGGKWVKGETLDRTLVREYEEEVGLIIEKCEKIGVVDFIYDDIETVMEVNIFLITAYSGEPIESDETKPGWFSLDTIPYELMWPDDRIWLPLALEGKKFKGRCHFKDQTTISSHNISVCDRLE